jgi:hypothetical protein
LRPAYENLQGRKPREGVRGRAGGLYGDLRAADEGREGIQRDWADWSTVLARMSGLL